MPARYRITIQPKYCWADFDGWEWKVFHGELELGSGTRIYRWLSKRDAEKFCKSYDKDRAATVRKNSGDKSLDYIYYPDIGEGFSNVR